jgi:hypothetical protein
MHYILHPFEPTPHSPIILTTIIDWFQLVWGKYFFEKIVGFNFHKK